MACVLHLLVVWHGHLSHARFHILLPTRCFDALCCCTICISDQCAVGSLTRNSGEDGLTLLDLLLADFPQLIHLRRIPRQGSLGHFKAPPQHRAAGNRISGGLGIDFDDADPRVLGPSIMRAVFQVA